MLWRSEIIPEIIWCWRPDGMCRALSEWWHRGHRILVEPQYKTWGLISNSMLLIERGTCAVVKNVFLHLEGRIEHCTESVADVIVG